MSEDFLAFFCGKKKALVCAISILSFNAFALATIFTSKEKNTNSPYEVTISKGTKRSLQRMQPEWSKRIKNKLLKVASDPYGKHNNVTKLQGTQSYRLRVGPWRVLYILKDNKLVMHVLRVLPRGDAYKSG